MLRTWPTLAAVLAAAGVLEAVLLDPSAGPVAGVLAALLPAAGLLLLPRRPLAGVAAVLGVELVAALTGAHPDAGLAPIGVALLAAGGTGRALPTGRREGALAAAAGLAGVAVLALLYREPDPSLRALPFFLALLGSAYAVGRQLRARALERDDLTARRQRLEHDRAIAVARAVAGERERIARELHAIISTSVDRVAVGAARAEAELDADPERAVATLREVRGAASGALVETRRLLGLLRAEEAAYTPQPGLAALADRARAGGYDLRLGLGAPAGLPAGLELTLVRIVEEAVAAVEPGRRSGVRVDVSRGTAELAFSVAVEGADPPWRERDPLLAGMHERVRLYGGQLHAVAQGAGWALCGSLPLTQARR